MNVFVRSLRSLGMVGGLLLLSGLVMSPAMAASVTYNFSGDVTGVNPQLASQFPLPPPSYAMSGSMTVNSSGSNGSYDIQAFHVSIGSYTATMGTSGLVNIVNGSGGGPSADQFNVAVNAPHGDLVNYMAPSLFDIQLAGPGNIFTSNALPNPAPSLSSFTDLNQFRLVFGPTIDGKAVSGSLTALTAVPLPASVILFGVGLVALIGLGTGGLRNFRMPQA